MFHQKNQLLLIGNTEKVDVRLDKEAMNSLVIQEAAKQEVGSSHVAGETRDVSELIGDSEDKAKPAMETQATRQTRATVVETLEVKGPLNPSLLLLLPTQCMLPLLGLSLQRQSSAPTHSTPHSALVVTPTSQFDPRTEEMPHFMEDDSNSKAYQHKHIEKLSLFQSSLWDVRDFYIEEA
ncbi:TMV resistance protein N-like [Pyrus ussuriensis x Pyrus communis]|uniref:TMV resistance protein N-like n=1 Tax=Pyrus ussuriensis x Pyrus communis TaxID=2448454 RepID=A0A5N5FZ35_9ROSA|nr:TMV resistance protein N-like [Pyrus ussuriensis x Pyrus communis]